MDANGKRDCLSEFSPESTFIKCPDCGRVLLLDDCDMFGADDGSVFCTHIGTLNDGRQWECGFEFNVAENVFEFDETFGADDMTPEMERQTELFS